MSEIVVRPLKTGDLAALETGMRTLRPDVHSGRMQVQIETRGLYLVAWDGPLAVGHLLLRWPGVPEALPQAHMALRPYLEGAAVRPDRQSGGIGTLLLHAAEAAAAARGHAAIGLAVGVENVRARALYERLGYEERWLPEFYVSWTYIDADGNEGREGEMCVYLVKRLAGACEHGLGRADER